MSETITIAGGVMLLERPAEATQKIAIFLPGISGGAMSERFRPLVDAVNAKGWAIARVQLWTNADEAAQKTFAEVHQVIDSVLELLTQKGYSQFAGIGKSFGGAVLLTYKNPNISKRVLWAPAVGAIQQGGNIEEMLHTKLEKVEKLTNITVDEKYLSQVTGEVCFVHGTADDTIPFNNSTLFVSMMQGSKIIPIDGADHSYKNPLHEQEVVKATVDFLI